MPCPRQNASHCTILGVTVWEGTQREAGAEGHFREGERKEQGTFLPGEQVQHQALAGPGAASGDARRWRGPCADWAAGMRPGYGRDEAGMLPGCGRDAAEMRLGWSRDEAGMKPGCCGALGSRRTEPPLPGLPFLLVPSFTTTKGASCWRSATSAVPPT